MKKVKCAECGELWMEIDMVRLGSGRRVQCLCPACYSRANKDVVAYVGERGEKLRKKSRGKRGER